MVAISNNLGSYALIAPVSIKPNADALRKLAEATGNAVSTTQTTLNGQSQDLGRFVNKVSTEADPLTALEAARGLSKSADISSAVADALKSMQQRFAFAQTRNATRPQSASGYVPGAAALAMLSGAIDKNEDTFDFASLVVRPTASKVKPNQISITAAQQNKPDVFDRGIPLTTAVGGMAKINVQRTALTATTAMVYLDPSQPELGGVQRPVYTPSGAPSSSNDAFYIKSTTGQGNDTVVLDTRDATGDDTRLSSIDLDTGDGSDVVFIAGNNVSTINAGAGDDFVAVEGDAVVNGGDGDDLIYARTASGDAGDDVIFSDGFASGGAGDDMITLFSLDPENDEERKIGYGGAGNDTIVASVKADIDGGEGEDVLILRDGGTAGGGAGNDTITAWIDATVEGGAGNDDILLWKGGSADGGDGDDKIESSNYATVSGGKGADTVTMSGGGTYKFAKGDGSDKVTMQKALAQVGETNQTPMNTIIIDGYSRAEMNVNLTGLTLTLAPTALSLTNDKIDVTREAVGNMKVIFRKNGQQQVLTITGLTQTLGPTTPIIN